jgi:hypothetical protein
MTGKYLFEPFAQFFSLEFFPVIQAGYHNRIAGRAPA